MKMLFFIFVMTILAGTNVQGACLDDWPSTWCSQVVELEMCDVTDYGLFKENLTELCKKTCGHCECEDIASPAYCAKVLENGECNKFVGGLFGSEMVWPCQKTCDFCDGQDCIDLDDECAEGETCYGGKCVEA